MESGLIMIVHSAIIGLSLSKSFLRVTFSSIHAKVIFAMSLFLRASDNNIPPITTFCAVSSDLAFFSSLAISSLKSLIFCFVSLSY